MIVKTNMDGDRDMCDEAFLECFVSDSGDSYSQDKAAGQ